MDLDSSVGPGAIESDHFLARLRRLGGLALVSLVLLMGTLVLWARSYATSDIAHFQRGRFIALAYDGELILRRQSEQPVFGDPPTMQGWLFFGFGAYKETFRSGYQHSIVLPLWFLAIAFAVMPGVAVRRVRREVRAERRRAENRCVACGYDLRGSPGPCPECGTSAAQAPADRANA
jgi:hypothetical protein